MKFFILTFIVFLSNWAPAMAARTTSKQFRAGDNLISILKSHGFSNSQRSQVVSNPLLRDIIFLTDISYLIKKSKSELELRFHDPYQRRAFRILKNKKGVFVKAYAPKYKTSLAHYSGTISGSLMTSLYKKTRSNWVASRFLDAYKIDGKNFRALPRGARYSLTVERKYEDGHFIKFGEVIRTKISYSGKTFRKEFVPFGEGGFFISDSGLAESRRLYAPVNYIRLASLFSPARFHPVKKRYQAHLGIDFELPEGSPVLAALSGKVIRRGYNKAAGNYVVLLHSGGIETSYNHLQKISKHMHIGKRITAGQTIGTIGCTGYCTKAHLHFALKKNGRMVDPLPHLKPYAAPAEGMIARRVAALDQI